MGSEFEEFIVRARDKEVEMEKLHRLFVQRFRAIALCGSLRCPRLGIRMRGR